MDFLLKEQSYSDSNDIDQHGMDSATKRRLKVHRLMQKRKVKPEPPIRSKMPYSLANVPKLSDKWENKMSNATESKLRNRRYVVEEAAGEVEIKPGAFKLTSKAIQLFAKNTEFDDPKKMLFAAQRDYFRRLELKDYLKIFGVKTVTEAQDVILKSPKKAMAFWMRNIGRVAPKIKKAIKENPENIPLWFYLTILHIVDGDTADLVLKKYFVIEPSEHWSKQEKEEDIGLHWRYNE